MGSEYCDERVCLSVCVCLSAIISSELHVRSSPKFLRMLPVAVARSCSLGVVISHVLPVLWMTSGLFLFCSGEWCLSEQFVRRRGLLADEVHQCRHHRKRNNSLSLYQLVAANVNIMLLHYLVIIVDRLFSAVNVSQGGEATYVRNGGIFNNWFL